MPKFNTSRLGTRKWKKNRVEEVLASNASPVSGLPEASGVEFSWVEVSQESQEHFERRNRESDCLLRAFQGLPSSHYYLGSLSWTSRTFYFLDSRDLREVLGGPSWQRERGGSLGDPPGP